MTSLLFLNFFESNNMKEIGIIGINEPEEKNKREREIISLVVFLVNFYNSPENKGISLEEATKSHFESQKTQALKEEKYDFN